MKRFIDLKIGDKVFYCSPYNIRYGSHTVEEISVKSLKIGYRFYIRDEKMILSRAKTSDSYGNTQIIFSNESEAIRYCKSNLIKELRSRITTAKKAIQKVYDLRKEYSEELNKDWIETEIIKLEKLEQSL